MAKLLIAGLSGTAVTFALALLLHYGFVVAFLASPCGGSFAMLLIGCRLAYVKVDRTSAPLTDQIRDNSGVSARHSPNSRASAPKIGPIWP